ncbi:MAG: hypothetical protein J3Q66DRAFT_333763 [Benniella sp.]|nr:MAG: hypothetical protein J3Q66DRAFT_333763 [Benniella sp.]
MPQRSLPLECILNILHILSQEHDTDTMARLLCVDKTICAAALSFLYDDCLNIKMHTFRPVSNKNPGDTTSQLIRTLLRQVHPQSRIPDVLRIAYLSQDCHHPQETIELPIPVFKYGHFMRKIVPDQELGRYVFDFIRNSPLIDYATTHQLYDKYDAQGLIYDAHDRDDSLVCALGLDVRRQLTWVLCEDYLESITTVSIPLTDIERYIEHMDQLKSLSKVLFKVEKKVYTSEFYYMDISQEKREQLRKELESERDRLFEVMIQFIQQHTSIHKNVLQYVEVPDHYVLPKTNQYSNEDVQFKVLSLLPPLHNPRSINKDNWSRLLARLSDTNLDNVESIKLSRFGWTISEEKTLHILNSQPPFLPRCRSLKQLEIETMGPDMFHWAVLEKKQKEAKHRQESIMSQHLSSWQHVHHNNLVPLQSVKLIHKTPLEPIQELNDIAFAFSDTLEECIVNDKWDNSRTVSTDLGTAPRVVHGHGWTLPRLRVLDFEAFYSQAHFDLDSLQRFCNLESLRLTDMITTYTHRDIRSWPSVNFPHLKKLDLVGSSALYFNLDSLHHLPSLEHLSLGLPKLHHGFYIPSPEDMNRDDSNKPDSHNTTAEDHGSSGGPLLSEGYQSVGRRPRFTWDWYLPNLRELDLNAVFAYKFDFQWLQHLPKLQSLQLNTSSSQDGLHERSIASKDLSRGSHSQRQQHEDGGHRIWNHYLSSPTLEKIQLLGHWTIDSKALEILCLLVAPNLSRISFGASCVGHTLEELVALSRKMLCKVSWCLDRWFNDEEIQNVGLVSMLREEDHRKHPISYSLLGRQVWDVTEP